MLVAEDTGSNSAEFIFSIDQWSGNCKGLLTLREIEIFTTHWGNNILELFDSDAIKGDSH